MNSFNFSILIQKIMIVKKFSFLKNDGNLKSGKSIETIIQIIKNDS